MDHFPNGRPRLLGPDGRLIPAGKEWDGDAAAVGIALPHGITFVARQGGAENTYWHDRFDEAMRHARESAIVMENDASLQSLVQERMLAIRSLPFHLEVPDERDGRQKQVRDGLERLIRTIPRFRRIIEWLSSAIWYGRAGVQIDWGWTVFDDFPPSGKPPVPGMKPRPKSRRQHQPRRQGIPYSMDGGPLTSMLGKGDGPPVPGTMGQPVQPREKSYRRKGLIAQEAWPVNGDKIGHHYDHTPYILVDAARASDLHRPHITTTTLGRALSLRGTWRERFIIHKHLMEDADFFAPERAEAVHGVGIRSKVFWLHWIKTELFSNIIDFFDRVGLGVNIWQYPQGNTEALEALQKAAREQSGRANLFVPIDPATSQQKSTVQRLEVPTAGADALRNIMEYLDKSMERYIVGQEASSRGTSSGMGNEANALFQQSTKNAITIFDAQNLAETLTGSPSEPGLVNVMQRYTFPWSVGRFPVKFVFDVEKPESDRKLQAARAMIELGMEIKADEVRAAAGFTKPSRGDELVSIPQQAAPGGPPGMPGIPPPGGPQPGGVQPGAGGPPGGGEAPISPAPPAPKGSVLDALQMRRTEKKHDQRVAQAVAALKLAGRTSEAHQLALRYAKRKGEVGG